MELTLNQNRLSSIPDTLADCDRLKILRVEENCLPLEAFTERLLVQFLFLVTVFLENRFNKLRFAGDKKGNVNKTSLRKSAYVRNV